MLFLFGLIFSILIIISLVLPWFLWAWIHNLKKEIETLKPTKAAPVPQEKKIKPTYSSLKSPPLQKKEVPSKPSPKIKKALLEQNIMANLPVWIGGIALALAGFFMVKYSIETGLLSPAIRLSLGGLFGVALLAGGNWVQSQPHFANNIRISQALSGAGIAVLYTCLYAATSLYSLIPPLSGFSGMALVTAIAVVLSLRQGAPIAMLGLIGGFLTPALIESKEPNVQFLFLYLYFVLAALFIIIRKKNWWYLSLPVVSGAFLWVLVWLFTQFSPADGLWLGLFLIALSITAIFNSKKAMENGLVGSTHSLLFNISTLGGAVLLMTAITVKSNFGDIQWGLFALLAAGGLILSYFNQKLYGFVPWLTLGISAIMFLAWKEADPALLSTFLILFAALFSISSYGFMWRSPPSTSWGILSTSSALLYYALAYVKFHNLIQGDNFPPPDPHLWSLLAFGLFILSLGGVIHVLNRYKDNRDEKQKLLASFTLTTAAFLVIVLALECEQDIFRITLAAEVLVISWLNRYVNIKALRPLSGALSIGFGLLLIPFYFSQLLLFSESLTYLFNSSYTDLPTLKWSFLNLGLPALLFAGASILFRHEKDDLLVRSFEIAAIALFTVMTNNILLHAYKIDLLFEFTQISLINRYIMVNILFFYSLLCLWGGRIFKREAISCSGMVLLGIAIFQLIVEYLLIYCPYWSFIDIGSFPFINALLLIYGLPIIWLFIENKELIKSGKEAYLPYTNTCLFLLLFVYVSLNIRQLYQGPTLYGLYTSNAEVYTYSVVWILMGFVFLFFGALKKNKTLHIASFAFIILSVAKVFLYDAAELTGLLRVFSFLGLGLSLLGLSWFYTRFVFQNPTPQKKIRRKK